MNKYIVSLVLLLVLAACSRPCFKVIDKARAKCPELFVKDTIVAILEHTVPGYVLSASGSALSPCDSLMRNVAAGDTSSKGEAVLIDHVDAASGVRTRTTMNMGSGKLSTEVHSPPVFITKEVKAPCECILTDALVSQYMRAKAQYNWQRLMRFIRGSIITISLVTLLLLAAIIAIRVLKSKII